MSPSIPMAEHPLVRALRRVDAVLDEVAELDPTFLPTGDKARALLAVNRELSRLEGLRLELLAAAGDVAEQEAARRRGSGWRTRPRQVRPAGSVRIGWPRGWGGGATYDVRCATAC
jgi:hypothetical protein